MRLAPNPESLPFLDTVKFVFNLQPVAFHHFLYRPVEVFFQNSVRHKSELTIMCMSAGNNDFEGVPIDECI
jgi:hypothetical protein